MNNHYLRIDPRVVRCILQTLAKQDWHNIALRPPVEDNDTFLFPPEFYGRLTWRKPTGWQEQELETLCSYFDL